MCATMIKYLHFYVWQCFKVLCSCLRIYPIKIISELAGKAVILGLVRFLYLHIQMVFRLSPVLVLLGLLIVALCFQFILH